MNPLTEKPIKLLATYIRVFRYPGVSSKQLYGFFSKRIHLVLCFFKNFWISDISIRHGAVLPCPSLYPFSLPFFSHLSTVRGSTLKSSATSFLVLNSMWL